MEYIRQLQEEDAAQGRRKGGASRADPEAGSKGGRRKK